MATGKKTDRVPTEAQEQRWLFQWAAMNAAQRPELGMLFHIPNEGRRSPATGARMRREGLKKGVPDLFLPVARGPWHGLFIELKRLGGRPTPDQRAWIDCLRRQGYWADVCCGWQDARDAIEAYLGRQGIRRIDR